MQKSTKKLAVVFPGVGYHTDKPLLYYAKRLAEGAGFAVREVHYRGFPKRTGGWSKETIHETAQMALEQTDELLYNMNYGEIDELLFLSKSIGTAVGAAYAEKHRLPARHVLFTPLEETFRFAFHTAVAFHGTKDQYVRTPAIEEACRAAGVPLHVTRGANHSLETGEVEEDLRTMQTIMQETERFIRCS